MNRYTKSEQREWTENDVERLRELQEKGYTRKEIASILNRTEVSIMIKLKRLGKKENTYNANHVLEKQQINRMFIEKIKPKTILDLYAGDIGNKYDGMSVTTNDKDEKFNTDYHEDAYKLLCKLYYENKKYDYIDLDPFGSAYDCIDLAIKMAKKGISITLGELGHKRFRRCDYVRTRYNINSMEEFTIEKIIEEIKKIGIRNKKNLIVYNYKEWQRIGRVWFEIEPYKITEQWEGMKK